MAKTKPTNKNPKEKEGLKTREGRGANNLHHVRSPFSNQTSLEIPVPGPLPVTSTDSLCLLGAQEPALEHTAPSRARQPCLSAPLAWEGAGLWGGQAGLPLHDRGPFLTALAFKLPQFGSRTPRLPPRAAPKPMGTRDYTDWGGGGRSRGGLFCRKACGPEPGLSWHLRCSPWACSVGDGMSLDA